MPRPLWRRLFGRRTRLSYAAGAITLICCLTLTTITLWMLRQNRDLYLAQIHTSVANLTQALASHAEDTLKQTDIVLVSVIARLDTPDPALSLPLLLARQAVELNQLAELLVLDAQGMEVASANLPNLRESYADRDYFQYHRQHADLGPHIGRAVRSRRNGEWVIPVSRRYNLPDGRFAGVVVAAIREQCFQDFYEGFDIQRHGVLAMNMLEGSLLARRPFDDRDIGRSLFSTPVFQRVLDGEKRGQLVLHSTLDGRERFYGFQKVDNYPLVAIAALDTEEALSGWHHQAAVSLGLTALGMLLFVAMGAYLTRNIFIRLQAEHHLRIVTADLEHLNHALEDQALHDGLTGISNRRHFDQALQQEFARAQREGTPLSLLMLDVDNFKSFNDNYGHLAGDHCLRRIAQVLQSFERRPGDLAARYGGEEFTVLLPNTPGEGALDLAETIRQAVQDLGIPHQASAYRVVTLSGGVSAGVPTPTDSPQDWINKADNALYRAKASGRNEIAASECLALN